MGVFESGDRVGTKVNMDTVGKRERVSLSHGSSVCCSGGEWSLDEMVTMLICVQDFPSISQVFRWFPCIFRSGVAKPLD